MMMMMTVFTVSCTVLFNCSDIFTKCWIVNEIILINHILLAFFSFTV